MFRSLKLRYLRFRYNRCRAQIDACRAMGDEAWLTVRIDALELLQKINALEMKGQPCVASASASSSRS